MTERRPHWDDDLIDAVIRAESDAHDYEYRAMAAIAAVEDWHSRQSGCEPPCTCWYDAAEQRLRAEKAEAQVQKVRRLTFEWAQNSTCPPWRRINAVRNILDGER